MATYSNYSIFAFFVPYGSTYWMDPMYLDSYQRNWEYQLKRKVLVTDPDRYQYRTIDIVQCHAEFNSAQIGGEEFFKLIQDQEIDAPQTHNTDAFVGRKGNNPQDTKAINAPRNIITWSGTWTKQSARTQRNGISTSVHMVLRKIASGDPAGTDGGWVDIPNPE